MPLRRQQHFEYAMLSLRAGYHRLFRAEEKAGEEAGEENENKVGRVFRALPERQRAWNTAVRY